ncbi:uncharacterized protein LOC133226429 [Neopsephotus bourkii]|uniref:uncharacterized protein LOC133226429 n=1 Tax=Neopsephotus bourkii TaxID=309878 RepID=UPI002AA523A0|nr:uncharacterized protein LOC133226429 [Neopsephotus bourkii]
MRDSCICDKEELISIVDVAMTDPASWLTEVPVIISCIYNNLEHINTVSTQHALDMLLLKMAQQRPAAVILRLVHLSPACDSVAMGMWEVLLSRRLVLENVLRELNMRFHYLSLRWRFNSRRVYMCIQLLALLASSHVTPTMFAAVYKIQKLMLPPRLFSLLLQGLVTLSQSPDSECSQTRELSICLFKDIIQMADRKDKRQMKKKVQRSLVPLVLHMSDEIESVAKASQEALWAAAKVLKCKGLSPHVETLERWRTVELLVRTSPRLDTGWSSHLPTLRLLQEAHLGPGGGTGGSQELQTLLCLRLSLSLSPTGLLAGRCMWPEEQGEVWGAGRRERPR